MAIETTYFNEIALLITHYNRSLSLERLLQAFEDKHIRFHEIIVSDDCSRAEHLAHLEKLKEQFGIKLILTEKNKGLANNINKGQRAVTTPYTLYVQEDFIPTDRFCKNLIDGLTFIKKDPKLDLVRFYAYEQYPYLIPYKKEFLELKFHFWRFNTLQFCCYSDHPHLRRSNFLEKFGNYKEGIHSDRAEFRMVISFLQHKGKAVIHKDYQEIFLQENSNQEPSQVPRKRFRKYIQQTDFLFIRAFRALYKNTKFRLELFFLKTL